MEEDVVAFGDGEFLTDLSLTLVNSLKTLASEHIDLLCRKICLKQTVYKNANSIDNDGTRLCVFLSAHEATKCPHGHCLSFEIGCKGTAFF